MSTESLIENIRKSQIDGYAWECQATRSYITPIPEGTFDWEPFTIESAYHKDFNYRQVYYVYMCPTSKHYIVDLYNLKNHEKPLFTGSEEQCREWAKERDTNWLDTVKRQYSDSTEANVAEEAIINGIMELVSRIDPNLICYDSDGDSLHVDLVIKNIVKDMGVELK